MAGKTYCVKEQLAYYVTQKHHIGNIPIGYHAVAALENIESGASIRVRYGPSRPRKSYLPDNNGTILN